MYLSQSYYNYDIKILPVFVLLAVLLSIFTIISKNPIFSVLFLIGLFFTVALYLILTGLIFIGLSYLLVYVGAISILFLFILMLINVRISELVTEGKNSLPLALIIVLSFAFSLRQELILPEVNLLFDYLNNTSDTRLNTFNDSLITASSVSNLIWELTLVGMTHVSAIGNIFYMDYALFLFIISLILLLAMVGAIIITINRPSESNYKESLPSQNFYNSSVIL